MRTSMSRTYVDEYVFVVAVPSLWKKKRIKSLEEFYRSEKSATHVEYFLAIRTSRGLIFFVQLTMSVEAGFARKSFTAVCAHEETLAEVIFLVMNFSGERKMTSYSQRFVRNCRSDACLFSLDSNFC